MSSFLPEQAVVRKNYDSKNKIDDFFEAYKIYFKQRNSFVIDPSKPIFTKNLSKDLITFHNIFRISFPEIASKKLHKLRLVKLFKYYKILENNFELKLNPKVFLFKKYTFRKFKSLDKTL